MPPTLSANTRVQVIADAVTASLAVPLVFQPHVVRVKEVGPDGTERVRLAPELGAFVDGSLSSSFPLETFDSVACIFNR